MMYVKTYENYNTNGDIKNICVDLICSELDNEVYDWHEFQSKELDSKTIEQAICDWWDWLDLVV